MGDKIIVWVKEKELHFGSKQDQTKTGMLRAVSNIAKQNNTNLSDKRILITLIDCRWHVFGYLFNIMKYT